MDSVEPVAAAASMSAAAPAASSAVPGAAAAAPPAQVAGERAADGNAMAAAGEGLGLDTSSEVSYPRFVMAPPQRSWQQQQQPLPQQQFQQVEDDEEASLMGRRRGEGAAAWAAKQVQWQNSSGSKDGGVEGDLSEIVHIQVPEHGTGWKKLLAYVGPGFLVAIAYIDPANFESDLQAGAQYKYSLLWVLLLASLGGLLIQSLCANLGIVTGKHLAEHCRLEYPKAMRLALWIIAEVEIIASDIPEVIGTAFALNILFGLKLWIGVVATGFSTIGLLAIQRYGIRWLELFIGLLVMVIAVCFFVEMAEAPVSWPAVARGMFVPVLQDTGATAIAISLVGAVVMPHNLFLHSALVLSRKLARTEKAVKDGCHYCLVEVSIALVVAFAINVAVICVGSAVCNTDSANAAAATAAVQNEVVEGCKDITLNNAHILLQNTLGPWASTVFGVALLASGQSSTVTGTYAGQYVMAGFLDLRMKTWLRNLITRLAAIVPSLAVALLGGSKGAGQLIIISSMVLSFGLPYALIPLLKFTSTSQKMGPFANTVTVTAVTWVVGFLVIAVNCFFVIDVLRQWTPSDAEPSIVAGVVLPLLLLLLVLLYVASLIFLALRPNQVTTYDESPPIHCTWLSTSNRPSSPSAGAATASGFAGGGGGDAAGGGVAGAAAVGGGEEGLRAGGGLQTAGREEDSEHTGLLLGARSTSDKG